MPSRHLLYWLGNIFKLCTVNNTSECGIDNFEGTDSPWERIEKRIEQIEKTPGDDNIVVETNDHWFNHASISNTLKYHCARVRVLDFRDPQTKPGWFGPGPVLGKIKNSRSPRTSSDRDREKFQNLGTDRTKSNKILKTSDRFRLAVLESLLGLI